MMENKVLKDQNSTTLLRTELALTASGKVVFSYDWLDEPRFITYMEEHFPEDPVIPEIITTYSWIKGYLDELQRHVDKYLKEETLETEDSEDTQEDLFEDKESVT